MAEKKIIDLEVKSNINDIGNSVGSLKSQLRNAQAEVAALSDKFGDTSKEAIAAARNAAILKDKIGDAKSLTDAFNPDAKFRALSGTLTGVAGGFSAVTGVMGALGSESKDVEKAILKVQSAMAIASGLQAVGESVDQFKQLGAVLKNTTVVQRALTVATTTYNYVNAATTVGLKLLRGALIATGVGAFAVLLGVVIANFSEIKATILRVVPVLGKVGDGIMYVVHAITDFIGATSESERAVDKLSKAAAKSLKNNEQYLKEHGSQLDEYTKQKINAKNEYYKLVEEDGKNQKAYAEELNRKLKNIDNERLKSKKETKKEEVKVVKEVNKEIDAEEQKRLNDNLESAKTAMAILDELAKSKETPAQKELREYQEKKAVLEANNLDTTELTNAFLIKQADDEYAIHEETLAKKKEQANKEIEIDKAVYDAKKSIQDGTFNNISAGIGLLKGLFEKNKGVQKALLIAESAAGIAKIVINTQAANAAAKLKYALLPGGIALAAAESTMNNVSAGIGIATNIAATAKGLSALGGGSTVSVGTGSSGGGSAPAPPSFNVVGASPTNQLAQTIGNKEQQPIKAYVVSSDVSTAQSLDRNIISSASIG